MTADIRKEISEQIGKSILKEIVEVFSEELITSIPRTVVGKDPIEVFEKKFKGITERFKKYWKKIAGSIFISVCGKKNNYRNFKRYNCNGF